MPMRIVALGTLCLLLCAEAQADDWTEQWFDNAIVDSPASFQSQKRGYLSGGAFTARFDVDTEYLMSVSMPRLKMGCGGIDAYAGGLSFLDPDYLVEKFESMLGAAAAVAFDEALKAMCKECSETMKSLEEIANMLNGIQLNECGMAKAIGMPAGRAAGEKLGNYWAVMTSEKQVEEGTARNQQDVKDDLAASNGRSIEDLTEKTEGCSAEFQDLFREGSMVDHAAEELGLEAYAEIVRGYIGDIVIVERDGVPIADPTPPCPENRLDDLDDFLYGRAMQRTLAGVCEPNVGDAPILEIRWELQNLGNQIALPGGVITADMEAFIDRQPLPVYNIMKRAVAEGNPDETISLISDLVATAYAWRMLQDLLHTMQVLTSTVYQTTTQAGVDAGAAVDAECKVGVYDDAIQKVEKLERTVQDAHATAKAAFMARLNEQVRYLQFVQIEQERSDAQREAQAEELVQ